MKKYFTKSLWLIIAALLVVSCSKEDGVMDSSSRSDKLEVCFSFFEKSIAEIESRAGSADGTPAETPCILKRGVTVLQLDSRQEPRPDYIKAFKYQISGNCGNVFDPSTGHCLKAEPLTRTYDISGDKYKGSTLRFTIYFFLGDDDVSDIKLTTQSVDTYDKTVKDLSFENVHMVQGKMTIYKGPFLSTHSAASFLIDSPTIPGSGFNIEF